MAKKNPLVSVCIGTYNRERYIRECMDSVLAQNYPNLEIVVVDDASTDATVDIVRSYGDAVRLVVRDVNSGVCQVTRNQASRLASGTYIAYLDSDDAWLPGKLHQQVAFMEAHPAIPLSHTYCEVIDADSRFVRVRHEGVLPPTGPCFTELINHCFITISTAMVRRSLFDQVGYFDEDRFWRIGEDYEFFLRVAKRYPIGLVDAVLGKYRRSDSGITANNWTYTPRCVPIHVWLLEHKERWEGSATKSQMVAALSHACCENYHYWLARNDMEKASWFVATWRHYHPFSLTAWKAHFSLKRVRG
jgi:glycosyltransferase involved in cell wall biosynthesis